MAQSLAVVCEGPADQRTGCDLADRVLCDRIHWMDEETLAHSRKWRGFNSGDSFLSWAEVKRRAAELNIKSHGFFDGRPAAPDAHAAKKALLVLKRSESPADFVILLRDEDGDPSRREGLEQARRGSEFKNRIAIGLAVTMRECWVLAGFDPQNDAETDRLAELRRELGFDPRHKAEQLTAGSKDRQAKKNPKRVLETLTEDDPHREAECWQITDLQTLKARGKKTCLAKYLDEVQTRLVPLLTPCREPS